MPDDVLLDPSTVDPDPLVQLARWWEEARAAAPEPERSSAMTVATTTTDGRPSARVVLLRGLDARGLVFYTSYGSRKAGELATNPRAAAVLHWVELARQVRVEGTVSRLGAAESDAYFASRPRGHRLGAWASPQSQVLPDRATLEARLAEVEARYPGETDVPRPPGWGGYLLTPDAVELWQSGSDRLHDRVRYTRDGTGWRRVRLAP